MPAKDKHSKEMYYKRELCPTAFLLALLFMAELPLNNGCDSFSEPKEPYQEQSYDLFGKVTADISKVIELGFNKTLPPIVATINILKIVSSTSDNHIQEEIVKNNIEKQRAVLESINANLEYIKQLDDNPSSTVHWIDIMRNNIQILIFDLDGSASISKRYPHDFMPILAGLASVIPIHTYLEKQLIHDKNPFFLPCETLRTLKNYKQLAHYEHINQLIKWKNTILTGDACTVEDSSGLLAWNNHKLACCGEYSDRLRSFVYGHFAPIVSIVDTICNNNILGSANGIWTVNFAEILSNRFKCDAESFCDFYLKIFINNELFHTTGKGVDTNYDTFFVAKAKKPAAWNDRVRIEIWDYDDFLNGGDDLMKTLDTTIAKIVRHPRIWFNGDDYINVYSTWMEETIRNPYN